jgi:hypothetical protein
MINTCVGCSLNNENREESTMESTSTLYEHDLEKHNETLTKRLEETELLLDNINETQEDKEKKYQEVIKESLDTIYQLATALHKYKTIADQDGEYEPTQKELEVVGKHYLNNFIRYTDTHRATVSNECEEIVDDFLSDLKDGKRIVKLSA